MSFLLFLSLSFSTNMDSLLSLNVEASDMLAKTDGVKSRCREVQLDGTKFFFSNDVVREQNKLPPSLVECDTINSIKNKLDHHLLNQDIR